MFEYKQLKNAIEQSHKLIEEDKKFLSLYNKQKNRPGEATEEESEWIETVYWSKLLDKEFNGRLVLFEEDIKKNNLEFPI